MVYVLAVLCALLAIAVLLLLWKLWLLRRSAEELRRGVQERLETDTNTLLSIPSRDGAMCRLAAGLNVQLRQLRRELKLCGRIEADIPRVRQSVQLCLQKRIGLWKLLILDTYSRDPDLLQLLNQSACIVKITLSRIPVHQYRQITGIIHILQHIQKLRVGDLIIIPNAQRCCYRQSAGPDSRKPRLLNDLSRKAVVCLHQKKMPVSVQQLPKSLRLIHPYLLT